MTLAIGRLQAAGSGKELGTAFAVTSRLALTALHNVGNRHTGVITVPQVRCVWPEGASDATVQDVDTVNDVALLRLSPALPNSLDPVPLSADVVANDQFVARGAPGELRELDLFTVSGLVIASDASMPDGARGIELLCWSAMAGLPLHGMSGAPVLTGNPQKAIGLLRWNPQQIERPELAIGGAVYAASAARSLERWPQLAEAANLADLLRRLVHPSSGRDPAVVYADVRTLLLAGGLGLDAGDLRIIPGPSDQRSRLIAIDTGYTIISVERDLTSRAALTIAEQELADAVITRTNQAEQRYAAVLTDGIRWRLYQEVDRRLRLVDAIGADPRAPGKLLGWLEAVVATGRNITPSRDEIEEKLGAASPAYKLDAAELRSIYAEHRDLPTVQVKRRMWAKLLTTASGTGFADEDSLFIDHTLLVATAKVIGHAVLGIQPNEVTATALMSGALFSDPRVRIMGVIEADFFGWISEVPGGEQFIKNLARRLARFDWGQVNHDVLKHLYESIISPATRYQLGEYYTPDWLAERIVAESVNHPLEQRVLDASCGSGTFLFHAIRAYLAAAEAKRKTTAEAISGLVKHVIGIDVQPVAVTLARVTYLLAIGAKRLEKRPAFSVPVFLGDSLRWGQETDLLTYDYDGLSVSTRLDPESFVTGPAAPSEPGFSAQLNFPDHVVADTDRFDQLVTRLAHLATSRQPRDPIPPLEETFHLLDIRQNDEPIVEQTFATMCQLHDEEKDHIWGYYVRNLARPAWLARQDNQVDVLVGNPPWLVYRSMTKRQQDSFRAMSSTRGLWAGGTAATSQDLAALFVARCVELYLRPGGQFGYVMPWAVLPRPGQDSRGPHAGFRAGSYSTGTELVQVAFTRAWDLHRVKPTFFRLPASVIFGRRQKPGAHAIPLAERPAEWSGRFATKAATWAQAEPSISIMTTEASPALGEQSPYARRFSQGATVLPRLLFLVEDDTVSGWLGTVTDERQRAVRSRRSSTEKKPWKDLSEIHGAVEEEFIRPIYLGQCILPFRCLKPLQAVIPWDGQRLLHDSDTDLSRNPGLAEWWAQAESTWTRHDNSHRLSLIERLDFRHGLTRQFPAPRYRIVYNKSGAYLAAAIVTDTSAVIDHKLYWGPVAGLDEARYLVAILNSSIVTMAVRPMQARGEHNPRDFDKYVFRLPIPQYDMSDANHAQLAILAEYAEQTAARAVLPRVRFELQRKYIREVLDRDGVAADINAIVKSLLDTGTKA